jgi:hypothetical protein
VLENTSYTSDDRRFDSTAHQPKRVFVDTQSLHWKHTVTVFVFWGTQCNTTEDSLSLHLASSKEGMYQGFPAEARIFSRAVYPRV